MKDSLPQRAEEEEAILLLHRIRLDMIGNYRSMMLNAWPSMTSFEMTLFDWHDLQWVK